MAKRRIEVDIVANDQASGVFNQVRSNASGMVSSLNTVLSGSVKFENALRGYNNSMYRFNRITSNVLRTAGGAIYNFTKDAINNFSELERQHAKTMGAMATDYAKTSEAQAKFLNDSEKLKQQAIRIGTYGTNGKGALNSITDVSYAQTALIKSGMSADDLLNSNAVEAVLKFAGGNDLDIDTATTFAVNLGTVFDKPVEQWDEMLDMVTKAADISVISVEDIMDSLTYTGGIASGLGRDLEEVLGVISVMGQAGLHGRVAGTGLQAFFTRILSAGELSDAEAGKAPTDYVAQMYNAFTTEAVNSDGTFKGMDEVSELLDTAMSSLNDQEQAWFAKKLFGLYQMKAAYALTGAVDGDINLITEFINQIENESAGTNDTKYELMQASQYGKIASLKNAWEGIKTDIGDRMSPMISAVADELLAYISNNGDYVINTDNIRKAINESGQKIGEKYGQQLGEAFANLGNLGVDAGVIAGAMAPYVGGLLSGYSLLLQGDIAGALSAFHDGLEATNENIDELPPELQGTATAARNVIVAFTNLATINLATQILQIITTAFNTFIAKPIKWITSKITSGNTTIQSPNVNIASANYVGVNTSTTNVQAGTATTVNIGSVPLMNVTATVVNVYGGLGGLGGNPSGSNPLLPGGSPISLLPSGGTPLLPSGSPTNALPSGSGINSGLLRPSTSMSTFSRASLMLYTLKLTMSMRGSDTDPYYIFGKNMEEAVGQGLSDDEIKEYVMANQYGMGNKRGSDKDREFAERYYDALLEQTAWFNSEEGLADIKSKIISAYNNGKDLDENFFDDLFTFKASNGFEIDGTQKLATEILNKIFSDTFKPGFISGGSYNDSKMEKFIKEQIGESKYRDLSPYESLLPNDDMGDIDSVLDAFNAMSDRIQSPSISINVVTNVDKNGNAITKIDMNSLSNSISRRSSQYGQVAMDM